MTVLSATASEDVAETLRKTVKSLGAQKEALEAESEAIVSELTSPPAEGVPPMGIETPLVDSDGYPRADIDVYRARTLRNRLAVIRTDHKQIVHKIDQSLVQLAAFQNPNRQHTDDQERKARLAPKPKPKYDPKTGKWVVKNWDGTVAGVEGGQNRSFDRLDKDHAFNSTDQQQRPQSTSDTAAESSPSTNNSSASTEHIDPNTVQRSPFCRVDAVAQYSPADMAGLREEDLIVEFGSVHHDNHNHLRAIANLVPDAAGENKAIRLLVQRTNARTKQSQYLRLELRPQPWSGRGLLGCHIVPYHG